MPWVCTVPCDTPPFQVCRGWTQRSTLWAFQTVFATGIKQNISPWFFNYTKMIHQRTSFFKGIQMHCQLHHLFLRDGLPIGRDQYSHLQGTSAPRPCHWPWWTSESVSGFNEDDGTSTKMTSSAIPDNCQGSVVLRCKTNFGFTW